MKVLVARYFVNHKKNNLLSVEIFQCNLSNCFLSKKKGFARRLKLSPHMKKSFESITLLDVKTAIYCSDLHYIETAMYHQLRRP